MPFSAPVTFDAALAYARARSLLPTTGVTADLQRLAPAIKRRALFSATVDLVEPLQTLDDGVNAILRGETDQASVRLAMKKLWQSLGYEPDENEAGGLRDLSSSKRINLQIETNVDTARGYGYYAATHNADTLDEYPAQELFRATNPRDPDAARDWEERWMQAGGEFFGGRMIALKTDDVWNRLGDPDLFPDGLGNPWPPFAFNSGMDVRGITRDEAVQLGLIDADTQLTPPPLEDFNTNLRASPDLRSALLRTLIEATSLGTFDAGGVLHFKP